MAVTSEKYTSYLSLWKNRCNFYIRVIKLSLNVKLLCCLCMSYDLAEVPEEEFGAINNLTKRVLTNRNDCLQTEHPFTQRILPTKEMDST